MLALTNAADANCGAWHLLVRGAYAASGVRNAGLFQHKQHDYGGEDRVFANNPLTQDAERFPIIENYFDAHPDLVTGGVTWGWMLAALQSMHIAQARHYLSRIDIPVLALAGDKDTVTPPREIAHYLNYVPRMRTHIIKGARHDIMNEIAPVRTEAWQWVSGFLNSIL